MSISLKDVAGKIRPGVAVVGGGVAALAAVISQAAPHVVRFGAAQMVNIAFYPERAEDPQQWEWFPADREPFTVTAEDGTALCGFFLPSRSARPAGTVIILHGHMSCADHMAWYAQEAVKAGFNAVVYDARAHGKSGGNVCTFGIHEAEDARQIARKIGISHAGPVFLWGISMGAAVGAQALSGDTPFSGGVIFSPFSNLDAMISATLLQRGLWWVPGLPDAVRSRIRESIGAAPIDVSPESAARDIRVPVLVVHGRKDEQIPVTQGRAVFEAIPDAGKELLELPEAGHDDLVEWKKPWGKKTLKHVFAFLASAR